MARPDPRVQRTIRSTAFVSAGALVVLVIGASFYFTRRDHPIGLSLMIVGGAVVVITEIWTIVRLRRIVRDNG